MKLTSRIVLIFGGLPAAVSATWTQAGQKLIPDAYEKLLGQALDSLWQRIMTAHDHANGIEAITPRWMFALFSYIDGDGDPDDPTCNRAVVEAVRSGDRTTTFRALQEMVRENHLLGR